MQPLHLQNPSNFLSEMKSILSSIITNAGNFAIQYNYQSASIALIIMSSSVCSNTQSNCDEGLQDSWVSGTTTAMVLLGSIFGQLSMGYLGDQIGRNMAMLLTVSIACLFAFLQCVASGDPLSIYRQIAAYRFFLGIGLGGIYPLSATKASEDGSAEPGKVDGSKAAKTFLWQYPGILSPWLLAYILARNDHLSVDTKWRIVYGIGAIPLLISAIGLIVEHFLYNDSKSSNDVSSTRASQESLRNNSSFIDNNAYAQEKSGTKSKKKSLIEELKDPVNQQMLLGTGGVWFCYDISSYGVSLIAGEIIHAISKDDDDNVSSNKNIANIGSKECIAIACATAMTLLALSALPRLGLKKLQLYSIGFNMFILMLFAFLFDYLLDSKQYDGLFSLFIFAQMSSNSGQNITTYVLPSALFPKEIRTTFNGIACAMAKLGAFIGAFTYIYIAKAAGFPAILGLSACISAISALLTWYFVHDDQIFRMSTRDSSIISKFPHTSEDIQASADDHLKVNSPLGNSGHHPHVSMIEQFN